MIPTEKKNRFFVEQSSKPFTRLSGPFLPGLAIAVGSKPPLLTRFARIGLGTKLDMMQPANTAVCPRSSPQGTARFAGTSLAARRDGFSVFSG